MSNIVKIYENYSILIFETFRRINEETIETNYIVAPVANLVYNFRKWRTDYFRLPQ